MANYPKAPSKTHTITMMRIFMKATFKNFKIIPIKVKVIKNELWCW